ncbi:MAG: Choice-of-anchor protein [Bacteroidota bacterium]|nr:Choice-of-anchor protein [Bacteroidota bacterium]
MDNFTKIKRKSRLANMLKTFFFVGFILSATIYAVSRQNGITGETSPSGGCSCHSSSPSSNTTLAVTSQSGSFNIEAGATETFTITVSNSGRPAAGIDIAVKTTQTGETNIGALSPETGSGLQLLNNELTHSSPKNINGGTVSFTFSWTAPTTAGTYYLRAAANAVNGNGSPDNGDQWNRMTIQALNVTAASSVSLTAPAAGTSWCQGTQHDITWTSSGITNIKIELSSDGGASYPTTLVASAPASAGSFTWNIPAGQSPGNIYKIRLSDASNSSKKSESGNFSVAGAAAITSQPQPLVVCTGQQASFSVTVSGTGLAYQWRKNGVNISNANQSTYTITNVTAASAGDYDCVISNPCGNPLTSSSASLTVDISPSITAQPVSKQVCPGETVILAVTAEGTDINYKWRKDGVEIPGANLAAYLITSAKAEDAGSYDVIVNGKCNIPRTSNAAMVTVNQPPNITSQPQASMVCENEKIILSVAATGSGMHYQWMKDGANLPNSDMASFEINNAAKTDEGSYNVIITGTCQPPAASEAAMVTIKLKPVVTQEPSHQTVKVGNSIDFTVVAKGSDLTYQWRKDGSNLSGKTSTDLHLQNVQKSDAGMYDCIIKNSCAEITSKTAELTVTDPSDGPELTLNHTTIDFGTILVMTSKDTVMTDFIMNTGNQPLTITAAEINGAGAAAFSIKGFVLPVTLQPDETVSLGIGFIPQEEMQYAASVEFQTNASQNPALNLLGSGGKIKLSSSVIELKFQSNLNNDPVENSFNLVNNGDVPAMLKFEISGKNADLFKVITPADNFVLSGMSSTAVMIRFTPVDNTMTEAALKISADGSADEVMLSLIGNSPNSVAEDNSLVNDLLVYPNPSSRTFKVSFSVDKPDNIQIDIRDILGNKVRSFGRKYCASGDNSIDFDGLNSSGARLSSGKYIIIFTGDKGIKSYSLIIE